MKALGFHRLVWCGIVVTILSVSAVGGETLYNGIVLPDAWPPPVETLMREPMSVPYLVSPPDVIVIDVGRQLFVDDFLIEQTTLKRSYHLPEYHPANPVLRPDKPWEQEDAARAAAP